MSVFEADNSPHARDGDYSESLHDSDNVPTVGQQLASKYGKSDKPSNVYMVIGRGRVVVIAREPPISAEEDHGGDEQNGHR